MLIFVYGTLKEGCCNHSVLKKLLPENDIPVSVVTSEKYPMYKSDNYFPYLENQPGKGEYIKGELYDIDKKDEWILDQFEGVPTLYKKGKINCECENSEFIEVNCYFKAEETDITYKKLMSEWTE